MSRKLHLATNDRDTERGLSSTPGTGTPRKDVAAPIVQKRAATSANEDVGEIEEDIDGDMHKAKSGKKGGPKK